MLKIVETEFGKVEGVHGDNAAIMVFKGIPYAKPPVGKLRFMPPERPEKWDGVRRCDHFAKRSLQDGMAGGLPFTDFFLKEFYPFAEPMSEDSLYLNVWTAAESTEEKRPVMFWIHGGGLASGYGNEMEFDGEALAKKGVILVTINYRLGRVGFFAHPELSAKNPHGVSGNNTLLDQVAALQWVKENIKNFGGDPDNITVFGQSGGAAATLFHLASPLTEGLIHKAIVQSGLSGISSRDAFFGRDTLEDAEKWGVKVCEILGMSLNELYDVPGDELNGRLKYAEEHGAGRHPGESVDGYSILEPSADAVAFGHLKNIPVMTGYCSGDDSIFASDPKGKEHNAALARRYSGDNAEAFMSRYPEEKKPELYEYMNRNGLKINMQSFGMKRIHYGQKAPYLYYFDPYIPGGDEFGLCGDGVAYHSAELWFMFGTLQRCWRTFGGRYYDLSEKMLNYWTNFAKHGNPNGSGVPEWKVYDNTGRNYMRLNEDVVCTESDLSMELTEILDFAEANDCK